MDSKVSKEIDHRGNLQRELKSNPDQYYPTEHKQKNTVIKYTRILDYDEPSDHWLCGIDSVNTRTRSFVSIDGQLDLKTNRSLQQEPFEHAPKLKEPHFDRKIVTIKGNEKENFNVRPKSVSKYTQNAKNKVPKKDGSLPRGNYNKKEPASAIYASKPITTRPRRPLEKKFNKGPQKHNKTSNVMTDKSCSPFRKNCVKLRDNDKELIVMDDQPNKIYAKTNSNMKKNYVRPKSFKNPQNASKSPNMREVAGNNKAYSIIYVPLENERRVLSKPQNTKSADSIATTEADQPYTIDVSMIVGRSIVEPMPKNVKVDQAVETSTIESDLFAHFDKTDDLITRVDKTCGEVQADCTKFDSLCVPNVSLTKEVCSSLVESTVSNELSSKSLPNLQLSYYKNMLDKSIEKVEMRNSSYIIGSATLTYTTKQKIDFHVVSSDQSTSIPSKFVSSYPLNVFTVFKGIKSKENVIKKKRKRNREVLSNSESVSSTSTSLNEGMLMKPSEIINSLRLNNNLFHSEYVCAQFQKELNFIDSFFDSLQYLEDASVTEKLLKTSINISETKCRLNSELEIDSVEYDNFLSKLDSEENRLANKETTVASKSLCLLNLLIRDEQRRAKNLLFVLKMREDALKDFTKSQILWLESKKKCENTDIPTLKKKQRGALLKLQQECGEMQRMRKALQTLSEKRKAALMNTKRNIELRLTTNVDNMLSNEKRKLKRPSTTDRVAPIKCFELSSSGCEESSNSKCQSQIPTTCHRLQPSSAEKYVQTGDSVLGSLLVDSTAVSSSKNLVAVDGGYLNILFHNLALPEIFSNGKEYEVNEDALRNIVNSANALRDSVVPDTSVVVSFMNNCNADKSTTSSTARSLVDEFDLYYKNLSDQDNLNGISKLDDTAPPHSPNKEEFLEPNNSKHKDIAEQNTVLDSSNSIISTSLYSTPNAEESCATVEDSSTSVSGQVEPINAIATSEMDAAVDAMVTEAFTEMRESQSMTYVTSPSSPSTASSVSDGPVVCNHPAMSSLPSLVAPNAAEAEELLRQQLAIEREIKALEQQQCQLLVVREIPDKPPPPYTPPIETRQLSAPPKLFTPDDRVRELVREHFDSNSSTGDLLDEKSHPQNNPFASLIRDYCEESVDRQRIEKSDKPWHPYNLLPKRKELDSAAMERKVTSELYDILSGPAPPAPGLGVRRGADHIDDILFADWHRCETEWTNLQADEALVKNQVFENIFDKFLNDTVREYKRMVLRED